VDNKDDHLDNSKDKDDKNSEANIIKYSHFYNLGKSKLKVVSTQEKDDTYTDNKNTEEPKNKFGAKKNSAFELNLKDSSQSQIEQNHTGDNIEIVDTDENRDDTDNKQLEIDKNRRHKEHLESTEM